MGGFNYNFGGCESNYGHEAFGNNAWLHLPPILRNGSQAFLDFESDSDQPVGKSRKVNKNRDLASE
jgi:hypothetical protein